MDIRTDAVIMANMAVLLVLVIPMGPILIMVHEHWPIDGETSAVMGEPIMVVETVP